MDYASFRQFLEILVDNSDVPEDLCRHLFLSFIKKPALILPLDSTSTIGILPLATAAIPPPLTTTTTNVSPGAFPIAAAAPASSPSAHRTFDIADRLSGFSLFSDRFFPKKRSPSNFTDDTGTGGSNDLKARTGKMKDFILFFHSNYIGVCPSGRTSLMRRGNSHDQHHDSPNNSRQSSRKSNPSIHSIHSLHTNSK